MRGTKENQLMNNIVKLAATGEGDPKVSLFDSYYTNV